MPVWIGWLIGILIIGGLLFLIIKSIVDICKFVKLNKLRKVNKDDSNNNDHNNN